MARAQPAIYRGSVVHGGLSSGGTGSSAPVRSLAGNVNRVASVGNVDHARTRCGRNAKGSLYEVASKVMP